MLLSAIHKLINAIWNKEELPDQWKESITVPVHKKGDKTGCNNYRGISLLSTSYEILSSPGRVKNFHFSVSFTPTLGPAVYCVMRTGGSFPGGDAAGE
jgi:hypothetical protein